MPATIISGDKCFQATHATVRNGNLWLPAEELQPATGWELKPQGFCLAEQCVPIPPSREAEFRTDGLLNLSALARLTGQPLIHDDRHNVWSLGEAAETVGERLNSLRAPDFTLPDLDGRPHSLSDYRGQKVLLLSWASW